MDDNLTGKITTDGKSLFVDLVLKTKTNDYKCIEYSIIKVMDYFGIIVRYANPSNHDDNEIGPSSNLKFEIKGTDYHPDWTPGKEISIRIMPINDNGRSMKFMEPYFDERLAYFKDSPKISEDELLKHKEDWDRRKISQNTYIQNVHQIVPIKRPRIIKGDIVLGIKL